VSRIFYTIFPEKKVFAQNDGKMETFGVSQRYGCRNTLVLKFGNDLASGYIDKDGRITDGVNEFDKVIINLQEGTASMRANKQMSGGAGTYISWSGIENNARMLGLYEKYGFRDEDAVPDILRQWLTEGNREQKEDAVCVFTEVGKCIASLVKSLEQYYHIENVVLSGGSLFGASGREILHSANKALRDESKKITIICDNEMDLKYGCLVGLTYFAQDMKKRQLISKERPLQELFTIVQSTIPESMHGLGNALNDLEPLSEQEDVTADQILEALAEAKETHSPTDEEAKILVESGKPITFAEPNIRTGKDGFTWGELAGDSKILAFLGISASEMNVGMEEPVSECWIASDDEAYPSKVDLGNGPTMSLRELLDMHGEVILGKKHVEEYGPQLGCILKLLDARETLSVAVHPAAGYKAEPGKPERLPKPEMWKMLGPASVYLGLKDAVSPDNLKQAVPQPCESMKKILQKLKKLKWENKTLEKIIIENLRCFDKEPVIKAKLVGNGRLTEAELEELIKFLDTPGNLEGYLNVIDYDPDDLVDVPAATIHAIRGKSERKGYKPNPQSSFIAEWSKSPVPVTTAVAIYDRGDGKRARPNKEDPNATIEVMEQATTVTFNPFEKSEPAALRPVEIYPQDINGNTAFRLFESPVVIVEQMHIAEGADKGLVIEDIRGRGYAIFVENGSIEIHNEKSGSLKLRKGEGAIIPATISKSITIVSLEGKTIMQRWFAPLFDEKEKIRNDTQKSRKAADTTKFSPRRTFVERSKTSPVTPLFELVESAATNRRAEFVKAANELMSNISEEEDPDAGIDKQDLNTRTSAEIKDRVESATQTLYASNGEKVSQDLLATIGNMEKNFARFEADAIMTAIIPLARKFKKEGRKLVLPLETEWIPGYAQSRSLQRDALARSELAKEIRSIPERLRKMGLDNVAIVHKEINESLDRWIGRINNELGNQDRNDLSNIVSLTSETTTTYLSNAYAVSGLEEGKRPLLAGVNPENFEEYYKTHDVNSRDEQLDSQIMEMLAITLELALGKEAPNLPIVASYDKTLRIVIFLPEVKRVNYQELERRYRLKKLALHSA